MSHQPRFDFFKPVGWFHMGPVVDGKHLGDACFFWVGHGYDMPRNILKLMAGTIFVDGLRGFSEVCSLYHSWLVVGNMNGLHIYIYILVRINPTDFHIFQRGRYTTNQILFESFGVKIKEHRTVMDCAKA